MEDAHEQRRRLGRRIRALRRQQDLSQEQLGEKAEVNGKFIGEVERATKSPSFDVLVKLAMGLGVELTELMTFEHEELDRKKLLALAQTTIEGMDTEDLRSAVKLLRAVRR